MSRHTKLSGGESSSFAGSSRGLESGSSVSSGEGGYALRSEAAVFLSSPSTPSSPEISTPALQISSTAESVVLRAALFDGGQCEASPRSATAPLERGSLDSSRSLRDILADNVIANCIDADKCGERGSESFAAGAGIKVEFQQHDGGTSKAQHPDFVVRKDGKWNC